MAASSAASARVSVCVCLFICVFCFGGIIALASILASVATESSTVANTPVASSDSGAETTVIIVAVALGVGVLVCCGCCCFCFCPSKPGSAERAVQARFDQAFPVGSEARSGVLAIAEFVERNSMRVLSRVSTRNSFVGRLSQTRVSRYSGVHVRPAMDSFADGGSSKDLVAASTRDSTLSVQHASNSRLSSVVPSPPRVMPSSKDFRNVAMS